MIQMQPVLTSAIFADNMDALNARFPEIHARLLSADTTVPFPFETQETPFGQLNIQSTLADGMRARFYEESDIFGEISKKMADWQLNAEDFLFVVGLGLGYVPLIATRRFSAKPRIVIIEPYPAMLRLAMQYVDLRPLFAYERLDLYLGFDIPVSEIVGSYGERLFFGKNRLVSHGASRLLYGKPFQDLEREVVENIRVVRNIAYTAKHGGIQIFANTLKNLDSLFAGPDLGALKDCFQGWPAICVAAGPSLDKDLEVLKAVGNRALIICGDSAVRSLVDNGIVPHMVVTTDMNPINFEKMRASIDRLKRSVLVFSIEANPDNVRAFLGRRRVAVTARNAILNDWLGPIWSMNWQLPAMTSVSHTASLTALALGAAPIVLVGMDFAYTAGRSHARGSVFRYVSNPDQNIQVDGVRGYAVDSLPQLVTDRKQLENIIAKCPVPFIDTSLNGALIKGAENRSLQEVVDTMLPSDDGVSARIDAIDWRPPITGNVILAEFEKMGQSIRRFISDCHTGKRTCQTGLMKPVDEPSSHSTPKRVRGARKTLAAFERQNTRLLRLLKLIRYGDVQEIAQRLETLRTQDKNAGPSPSQIAVELEIYADHFASLEKAARFFSDELSAVERYFLRESELIQCIENEPEQSDNMLILADFYREHAIIWKAEKTYSEFIAKRPDDIRGWLHMARMFSEKGLWAPARTIAEQLVSKFPNHEQSRAFHKEIALGIQEILSSARSAMEAGRTDEARIKLYEFNALSGDDEHARALAARLDTHDDSNARAMIAADPTEIGGSDHRTLHQRVEDCLECDAVENAVGILEGAAQESHGDAGRIREWIGDVRMSRGDAASAEWHYRQALRMLPEKRQLAVKLDAILQQQSSKLKQETMMSTLPEGNATVSFSDISEPEESYQQAQAEVVRENHAEAIRILDDLVAKYPDFAAAHNDLGVLHFNAGKVEQAYTHYREAARIAPDSAVFQKNLADFEYIINGDTESALKIYVDLLSADPEDMEVLLALGQICMQQDRPDEAEVFFKRLLALDPLNDDAIRGLNEMPRRSGTALSDSVLQSGPEVSTDPGSGEDQPTETMPSPIVVTEIEAGGRRYKIQIPEQETFRIRSIFELNEYAVMNRRRNRGSFKVFDVGANVGVFALYMQTVQPGCRIYCFEPSPLAQRLLEANVQDLSEVSVHQYGLFNRDMDADMHVHRFNTGQNSIRFCGHHHPSDVLVKLKDAGSQFDALEIDYLDVLKIDTEGCEVEILESMGERLDRVDYVLAEYHTEADRRAIDALLKPFHLFGASTSVAGIGTVRYVHPSLV